MSRPTFYITTPIYYVNDAPHIGTAYCTITADVIARFKRLKGASVRFTTGTDEHGEQAAQAAQAAGLEPRPYCDRMVVRFIEAWKALDVAYDDFIRTTEERHESAVRRFVTTLLSKGDIYKGTYEGWYCVGEESFYPESKLVWARPCPRCSRGLVEGEGGYRCVYCQAPVPQPLPG
jgi:methionyl-tRNA synthetase